MCALVLGSLAVYDVLAPPGETVSERLDDPLEAGGWKRAVTLGFLGVTFAHLGNVFESLGVKQLDPYSHALKWKDRRDVE